MPRPQFATVSEIAETLDKSESTIYRWIKDGKLESQKAGDTYRVFEFQLARAIGRKAATEVFDKLED